MVNKIFWDEIVYENISVNEPKKMLITDKKGKEKAHWYLIGVAYTYPNGEVDGFRVEFPEMKTSGIETNEFEDPKTGQVTLSYQFAQQGFLDDKMAKMFDKVRKTICNLVAKFADQVEYLVDFNPDAKRGGVKRFYWTDKKDAKRRRWYMSIDKKTTLFLPSKKTKSGTTPISQKELSENESKLLFFSLEQKPIWQVPYFNAGGLALSIKNNLYQSLVLKVEAKGVSSAQAEDAASHLANNPNLEDENEENLRTARAMLASADIEDSDEDSEKDSDAESDDSDKPKKKKKSKSKGSDSEDEKPKKGKGKAKKEDSDSEDDKKKKKSKSKASSSKIPNSLKGIMGDDSDDEKPKKGKGKAKKESDDEEEKPKKSKAKKEDSDDEEEKPKKSKAKKEDSDDEEEKPKKSKAKKEESDDEKKSDDDE